MSRHPDGAEARTETIHIRFTPAGLAEIDKWRGHERRAAFVREAVADRCRHLASQQLAMQQITAHHKPGSRG
jgi:hypothetical protein